MHESLPARGAWIEILNASCGRGWEWSLPARGAWIEIISRRPQRHAPHMSLPARGAWIEILTRSGTTSVHLCRSPHGERGLKYHGWWEDQRPFAVAPRTGSVD